MPQLPTKRLAHHRPSSQSHLLPQDIYENLDLRQRRASSPGYIDSPTYSRQGMSPTFSRSPHHYYRSGKAKEAPKKDEESGPCGHFVSLSCRDNRHFPQQHGFLGASGHSDDLAGLTESLRRVCDTEKQQGCGEGTTRRGNVRQPSDPG